MNIPVDMFRVCIFILGFFFIKSRIKHYLTDVWYIHYTLEVIQYIFCFLIFHKNAMVEEGSWNVCQECLVNRKKRLKEIIHSYEIIVHKLISDITDFN